MTIIDLTSIPESDDVIVKVTDEDFVVTLKRFTELCIQASQKEFPTRLNNLLTKFAYSTSLQNIHGEGCTTKILFLFPGQPWQSGNVRVKLVVEFLPDEPEAEIQEKSSLLDDLRQDT